MAAYTNETKKHLTLVSGDNERWKSTYGPGKEVPVSGIYRCTVCGKEITSNKSDPFPPQNHHQHSSNKDISWQLIIRTDTAGDNFGIK
ncbi:protein L [Serratia fonticola]